MKKVILWMLAVLMLAGMLAVPVWADEEFVKTEKSEYLEGELIKVSYQFLDEDSDRRIYIYKDSVSEENRVWVVSATGLEGGGHHVYFWYDTEHAGAAGKADKPGKYIMKVVNKDGSDYDRNIGGTFTVAANPEKDELPQIYLEKTEYGAEETLQIFYKGISDVIGYQNTLKIVLWDSYEFPVEEFVLWNGSTYAGLSGVIEYDLSELWEGEFRVTLETTDELLQLGDSEATFTVGSGSGEDATGAPATEIPVTPAPATEAPAQTAKAPAQETKQKDSAGWVLPVVIVGAVVLAAAAIIAVLLKKRKK